MTILFEKNVIDRLTTLKETVPQNVLYYRGVNDCIDEIKALAIEINDVENEYEYLELFDDVIYIMLQQVGKQRGYVIDNDIITNEMISELRSIIIQNIVDVTGGHIDLSPRCDDDIVEKETLEVGDSIYVDNNETLHIMDRNNRYELVDLHDNVVGTFKSARQIMPYINSIYDIIEIIKDDTHAKEMLGVVEEDKLEVVTVDYSTLTPQEYNHKFDDIMYESMIKICDLKGINFREYTCSGLLNDIRHNIISAMKGFDVDISTPNYNLGDAIYVDNEECKIILLDDNLYGILSVTHYNIVAKGTGHLNDFIYGLMLDNRVGVEE